MPDAPRSISGGAALTALRDQTIEALSTGYSRDVFDLDELERRLERAEHAQSAAELQALVADLPDAAQAQALAVRPSSVALVPASEVPDRRSLVAVFGGARTEGAWTVPRELRVWSVMGGARLDFREARMGPGVHELRITAIAGGVEIIVPPGLEVELDGVGVLGGFEHRGRAGAPLDPAAPKLRVTGVAFMAGVELKERLPGETAWQARRRLRKERRLQRREARRLERARRHELPPGS
jgi:hypothetical protein